MVIDGGPSQADFWQFTLDITEALLETIKDDRKFHDFANQVGSESAQALRMSSGFVFPNHELQSLLVSRTMLFSRTFAGPLNATPYRPLL